MPRARANSESSTVNKPWVENYPALKEWLNKIGARCLEQVPGPKMAKSKDPTFYIEKWICGAREFYVEVRANRLGWNVYTGSASSMIADTLRDAEHRIGVLCELCLGSGVYEPNGHEPMACPKHCTSLEGLAADAEAKKAGASCT